jgi:nucleotide-binding universal stress UspA family protein
LRSPRERPSKVGFTIRRILVPWEPHHDSDAALAAAGRLATAYGSSVRLLTLVPSLADARSGSPLARLLPGATSETLRMEEEDVTDALRAHAAKLEADGIEVGVALRTDDPAAGILRDADEQDADLVILSTHARPSFEAWYTGSTGHRVVAEAHRALLLIREL